jgi:AraC-like DNA-binding protein
MCIWSVRHTGIGQGRTEGRHAVETVGESRPVQAVLTGANHFQFAPGDDLTYAHVASRTVLWGIAGGGTVECQKVTLGMAPGDVVLLPWAATVRYRAAIDDPFLIGTAHLRPRHRTDDPVVARDAERATGLLHRSAAPRQADDWPGSRRPVAFSGAPASWLFHLCEAATAYFLTPEPDAAGMRAFGHLFERAIAALQPATTSEPSIPPTLATMQEYARRRLSLALTTTALAELVSCSVSTVERQFRRYTGFSPRAWIREERLKMAAQLLRTTSLRVADIAAACGFDDPHYLTRAFRERYGVPPREYGRRPALF